MLTFGTNPQRFLKLSSINAIRFKGNNLADSHLDRKEIVGTVDQIIEDAAGFIERFSVIGSVITSDSIRRADIAEYPAVAVREAIANAVVHRDYRDVGSQIDLYMFDDRIEIRSPGGLGGGLTQEDLETQTGKRWARNPELSGFLYELKYIEKAGTGIPRMFGAMASNGSANPKFKIDANSVMVILPAHPEYAAKRKFEEAVLAKDRGEFARARALFSETLHIAPRYSEAQTAWAAMEGGLGNLALAREKFRNALESNPANATALFNWAMLESRMGKPNEARRRFEQAAKIDSQNPSIYHAWATMERHLGDLPKARKLYERATKLQPDSFLNWQSWAHVEMKSKRHQDAERLLKSALQYARQERDPYATAWILCDLAKVLTRLDRPSNEIEKHYKESLNLNPNSPETNYSYYEFLNKMNRKSEADKYRTKALRLGWDPAPKKRWIPGARRKKYK